MSIICILDVIVANYAENRESSSIAPLFPKYWKKLPEDMKESYRQMSKFRFETFVGMGLFVASFRRDLLGLRTQISSSVYRTLRSCVSMEDVKIAFDKVIKKPHHEKLDWLYETTFGLTVKSNK